MRIEADPNGLDRLVVAAPELDAEFEVFGDCPVQGTGMVLGRDLYFRAKYDGWTLDVADRTGNLPSDGYSDSDGFYREGRFTNASYMAKQKAVRIIVRCLEEYTGARAMPD